MISDIISTMKRAVVKPKDDKLMLLLSDKTKETQCVYMSQIRKFQDWRTKNVYTKWDVIEFLKHLQDQRFSSSFIRGTYYALRLFFESEGWLWEVKMPKLSNPLPQIAMSKNDVVELIQGTLANGSPEEKTYLALSTTYGLRRAELAQITGKDFDLIKKTIFIRTKKGGVSRNHLIPDSISPFLSSSSFNGTRSPYSISMLWHLIEQHTDLHFDAGVAWHAIRHRLNVELVEAGVPEIAILNFMRWRYKSSMVLYYFTPDQRESDEKIFSVHPFIPIWRNVI